MSATIAKTLADSLRVAVVAATPDRHEALTRLVRELGHQVVLDPRAASAVLADGMRAEADVATVVLGPDDPVAEGRLPRSATPRQIDAALKAVAAGLLVSSPEHDRHFASLEEVEERALLTPRELDVLSAVAHGRTNKEIARELGISQHTVKFHLESLMRKLGASSRAEAVSKSLRLRLLEPYRL